MLVVAAEEARESLVDPRLGLVPVACPDRDEDRRVRTLQIARQDLHPDEAGCPREQHRHSVLLRHGVRESSSSTDSSIAVAIRSASGSTARSAYTPKQA